MEPIRWLRVARPDDALAALKECEPGGWLVVTVSPDLDPNAEPAASLAELLAAPAETLVALDPALTSLGPEALSGPLGDALGRPDLLTLLVARREPPFVKGENHGPVRSCVGPMGLLRGAIVGEEGLTPESLAYWSLWSVFHVRTDVGVVARECPAAPDDLPGWPPAAGVDRPGPTAVLMPHRGSSEFLSAALAALATTHPAPEAVLVGLDLDPGELEAYEALAAAFPGVAFYTGSQVPFCHYVIRQELAAVAGGRFLAFHDSDDLSTRDRFHWLHADTARNGPGLVGSHELRYDEDDRTIRAVRFPLDVTAALATAPLHSQLHPTTMIPASCYQRVGGLSTDCVFGNDTQFLLRAYFSLPVRNVDRFLYIRRDRWESLTNAPETGMENPLRIARNIAWRSDFEEVKAGRLRLEDSSLATIAGATDWSPRRLAGRPPTVSIIMPTYRRPHSIGEAVGSILAQTYPHWELIVSDNGGDALQFDDPRIRVLDSQGTASAAYARNVALPYATGELLCYLDDDDKMDPDYLSTLVGVFTSRPGVKMVKCQMIRRGVLNETYGTPTVLVLRSLATPTWEPITRQDRAYYAAIIERNGLSEDAGNLVVVPRAALPFGRRTRGRPASRELLTRVRTHRRDPRRELDARPRGSYNGSRSDGPRRAGFSLPIDAWPAG